jgi:hypothetical protein
VLEVGLCDVCNLYAAPCCHLCAVRHMFLANSCSVCEYPNVQMGVIEYFTTAWSVLQISEAFLLIRRLLGYLLTPCQLYALCDVKSDMVLMCWT